MAPMASTGIEYLYWGWFVPTPFTIIVICAKILKFEVELKE